jgi:hypothetical protein
MTLTDQQITDLEAADLLAREAKALYDNARLVREREIRRVAAEGGTYRDIATVAGVAYQRVAQIVTSKTPPTRPRNDHLRFECPRCGAGVGEPCEGKDRWQAHGQRHDVAIAAFRAEHPELG